MNKDQFRSLYDFIDKKKGSRIIACCGSGGVGKTTISATIGLQCAISGYKTLVLTIDPAKRLANSLGITSIKHEEQRIPNEKFAQVGLKPKGELYAMMLDTKRTFDRLVTRYASESMHENIFKNRYYHHISTNMTGSHEYIAMEKLYELYHQNKYDIIVLDTPPSRRALDFLEQPERVTKLLSHSLFFKFFKPYITAGKWGLKMLNAIATPILKVTKQMMGQQMLNDVTDFMHLWDDVLFDGVQQRAFATRELLSSPQSLFLGITSPLKAPMQESIFLYNKLKAYNLPFGGFIVNRVHRLYPDILNNEEIQVNPSLNEKLISNFKNFNKLAKSDSESISNIVNKLGNDIEIRKITYFENDIYDFVGLLKVKNELFAL
ncbi:MAG: ArsA family ATPase [Desulfobacterales bacterium]|nr:ArsA family ATPase [Desulfobacterales bacterium]